MKSEQSIIFNGCPSIYMLSKLGRGFQILLYVETIRVLATFDNIFAMMVEACLDFGGLRLEKLGAKLVGMGCDGSSVFQGG
jgi:hypothetical protein